MLNRNDTIYIVTVRTRDYIESECYHSLTTALDIADYIVSTHEYVYVIVMMVNTIDGKPTVVKLYGAYNDR